ncbi:META domain-containing protein [Rubrivirga sp.]|uniref:META domain-containing protein n=1 Tax=Rubrivirga sp. TaxID=1885344 RepID=UPI003B516A58
MRLRVTVLALAVAALSGCDSLSPSDALVDLSDVQTDPAALVSDYGWAAVSAVSDGGAYRFPEGVQFYVGFGPDGLVGGRVSANSFGGRYHAATDGSFRAEIESLTRVGVSDRDSELTGVLLGELQQATRFEVSGTTLQVRSANGDGVRLEWNGFRAQ